MKNLIIFYLLSGKDFVLLGEWVEQGAVNVGDVATQISLIAGQEHVPKIVDNITLGSCSEKNLSKKFHKS